MDPMTSMELGRSRLEDLRAEARLRAVARGARAEGSPDAGWVRRHAGAALIAIGARLTGERVTRTPVCGG